MSAQDVWPSFAGMWCGAEGSWTDETARAHFDGCEDCQTALAAFEATGDDAFLDLHNHFLFANARPVAQPRLDPFAPPDRPADRGGKGDALTLSRALSALSRALRPRILIARGWLCSCTCGSSGRVVRKGEFEIIESLR